MKRRTPLTINGVECWPCGACGEHKRADQFARHSRSANGLNCTCKACANTKRNKWRAENRIRIREQIRAQRARQYASDPQRFAAYQKAHIAKHPGRYKARCILRSAVKTGVIAKPNACAMCGAKCVAHGHHGDYAKPLDVVWVCSSCHVLLHNGDFKS
jgi:hypothetical protein